MSLPIPNNKNNAIQQRSKTLVNLVEDLNEQGKITNEVCELFKDKINEGGELNLIQSQLKEKEKEVKDKLRNTKEYKAKIQLAKKQKQVRAMQERNIDETRGALELLKTSLGDAASPEVNKLLTL